VNLAAGGGGGAPDLIVDHGTLRAVADNLLAAGATLADRAASAPAGGDHGLAGPLVALMLGRASETAARLVFEARTLSEAVTQCNTTAATVDSDEAGAYLVGGGGS